MGVVYSNINIHHVDQLFSYKKSSCNSEDVSHGWIESVWDFLGLQKGFL